MDYNIIGNLALKEAYDKVENKKTGRGIKLLETSIKAIKKKRIRGSIRKITGKVAEKKINKII